LEPAPKTPPISVDDFSIEVLRRHRVELESNAEDLGTALIHSTPVLAYDLERPMAPDKASPLRTRHCRQGLDCHLHQLPHSAATQVVGGVTTCGRLSGRLGHANANTTLEVYAHALPDRDGAAAAALGAALCPEQS
jgi:integrase